MNVMIFALGAVRADHLSCYGYSRETSPFIDSLAAAGVRFENHFTPVAGSVYHPSVSGTAPQAGSISAVA